MIHSYCHNYQNDLDNIIWEIGGKKIISILKKEDNTISLFKTLAYIFHY